MLRLRTKLLRAGGAGVAAGFVIVVGFALWATTAHAGGGSVKDDDDVVVIEAPLRAWHGCYVGASAGGNIDSSSATIGGGVTEVTDQTSDGLALGGYVGCSLQAGSLVIGIEGDINTASGGPDYFGSARGRLGIAIAPTMLLYVTGGYAFADQSYGVLSAAAATRVTGTASGSVFGGGIEYAMGSAYSVRLEALHYDYDPTIAALGGGTAEIELSHTVVRFGVTVKLASGFFGGAFNGVDPDVIQ